ncbi:MAG: alpha/beta hydrolase [Gammaproteobacteria bacterium]|jgi:pimeloyl-ACP methyl ester carboxylesterase|nr:alpha/beta hydrolase [Gammaproteobacteria bacterium]MBT3858404.1 alpha/beta hydrolase [Gammaproteobacteria bacterium]MBT3986314.1 alpha/beta hydrolase [Gammaproteobacteria bacterium]MBT4255662.1 alpha/beta hydrolase [Gammaproteobacteria bacterium]MBT4583191.1 alpha/beta hydrolase [Gammaproteobacteria bacterium]
MTLTKRISLLFLFVCCSQALQAQDDDFVFYSDLARDWYQGGDYFEWTSTTEDNDNAKVNIFYRTWGDETKPKLVLIHGFPNSSFDYYKMIPFLEDDYHIATLDFPGSGFSDKPLDGFNYMLAENAEIVDHFVREVVGFEDFALYTHDRGVSIGLAFLGNYLDNPDPGYTVNYHFLSNSGMFLPLANLSPMQMRMLDTDTAERMLASRAAQARRTEGEPESLAYSDIFAFNQGNISLIFVGRYLLERQVNEVRWLENLPRSPVPVAYLWGLADNVNPVRISNHVWDTYLNDRDVDSSFWVLPAAGHYPQRDNPEEVANVIRMALTGELPDRESEEAFMRNYGAARADEDAVFVGHSKIEELDFPSSIEYTPSGYRVID